jgi:hypothetical protein
VFDSIPYNLTTQWHKVLENYFNDDKNIYLDINQAYSERCRTLFDNGGLISYYFRCQIPFPNQFESMMEQNTLNENGEQILALALRPPPTKGPDPVKG